MKRAERMLQTCEDVIAQSIPECRDTVTNTDLLTLVVGAPIVTDRDFKACAPQLADLGGYFDLESKARRRDDHVADNIAPKGFVARFNIGEIYVCQQIREGSENFIG